VSVLVLIVDDEPDVEALFRQQFRRDLRAQRFVMDFAVSASDALARVSRNIEQGCTAAISPLALFSPAAKTESPRRQVIGHSQLATIIRSRDEGARS
jgi:CheY-like chemotaxis protein